MDRFQQRWFAVVVATAAMVTMMVAPARGQISTPCNTSTISSFSPCMSFLTNSTSGGSTSSPTTQCCDSLKALTSGGMDCLCLIITGSVPFQLPINRTLAISLPRACRMPSVPLQCKASGSPLPAPGPTSLGPSPSPASAPSGFTPSPSPEVSPILPSPTPPSSQAPESDTTPPSSQAPESDTTPPSPSVDTSNTPSSGRSDLTPSSDAIPSYSFSPFFLLMASSLALLNYYYYY